MTILIPAVGFLGNGKFTLCPTIIEMISSAAVNLLIPNLITKYRGSPAETLRIKLFNQSRTLLKSYTVSMLKCRIVGVQTSSLKILLKQKVMIHEFRFDKPDNDGTHLRLGITVAKKGTHPKTQYITDSEERIRTVFKIYSGKTHDFIINKKQKKRDRFCGVPKKADNGYRGIRKYDRNV